MIWIHSIILVECCSLFSFIDCYNLSLSLGPVCSVPALHDLHNFQIFSQTVIRILRAQKLPRRRLSGRVSLPLPLNIALTMHLDSQQYVGRLNIIKHFNLKQTNFKQTTFNLKKTILNKQPRKQTDRQTKSKQYMEGHMYSIKRFLSIPSHLSISIWNKDKVYQLPVIQPVQCNGQAVIFLTGF